MAYRKGHMRNYKNSKGETRRTFVKPTTTRKRRK